MAKNKVMAIILVLFMTTFVIALTVFNFMSDENIIDKKDSKEEKKATKQKKQFNILLSGVDSSYQGQSRSDTLLVASVDLKSKEVGIISIPRDTRVKLPPSNDYHKINAAYSYGGVDLTKKTVDNFLGISIDYYLELDYQGFIKIVDTLGGVEIEIAKDLKYVDRADNLYIDLKAGQQRLSGEQALGYVRFRHDVLGDIGRIKRQQKFIKATVDKILSLQTLLKSPTLIKELNQSLKTDLGLKEMLGLASMIKDFNQERLAIEMLPGQPKYIEGISYWVANQQEKELVVDSLLKSKSYFDNQRLSLTVLNGNGVSGVAREAAHLLKKQGYQIKGISNANNFDYSQNFIISSPQNIDNLNSLIYYLDGEVVIDEESSEIKVIIGENTDLIDQKEGFLS